MANTINISGGLTPTVTNTPLDERTRVATKTDIASIAYPFVGMHVFVLDEKKEYIVDSLKSKTILGIDIPDSLIDEYHEFGSNAEILSMLTTMNATLNSIDARLRKEEAAQEADEWLEI